MTCKLKGGRLGECNRSACQTSHGVSYYHRLNGKYYCQTCADTINEDFKMLDSRPLCYVDVDAVITELSNTIRENSCPDKYLGDKENRASTTEHVFQGTERRRFLYIRGKETIDYYLRYFNQTIREGDIVYDPEGIIGEGVEVRGELKKDLGKFAPMLRVNLSKLEPQIMASRKSTGIITLKGKIIPL